MNVKCPTCRKETPWENNPVRPFCSERCKLIDLGEWASGKRGIPGDHDPSSEEDEALNKPVTGRTPESESEDEE